MTDTKNIYHKLQAARVELQDMELKKSGVNKKYGYKYYELGDILPAINELCKKYKMFTEFSMFSIKNYQAIDGEEVEKANLKIRNIENPEETVVFVAPTATPQIGVKADGTGGADPIQNLGGKITYMRRYMLMTAFEIVESDMVEQVKKQIVDEVSNEDLKKLTKAKTLPELNKAFGKLNKKYDKFVLIPHWEKRKEELKNTQADHEDIKEAKEGEDK